MCVDVFQHCPHALEIRVTLCIILEIEFIFIVFKSILFLLCLCSHEVGT